VTTTSAVLAAVTGSSVTQVFGVMGNGNALFIDALRIPFIPLRHEAGAVAAADAHARVTGGLGIATTTFGAGFTNSLTALADAVRARSSLVIVTGDAPTTGMRAADVDIPALAIGVGATSWTIEPGHEASTIRAAIESARGSSVPAVVSVPYDLDASAADLTDAPPARLAESRGVLPSHIIETILGSKELLLLAGRGAVISGAGELARRFAVDQYAATATTVMAHGMFGDYARHLGIAGGFGSGGAARAMRAADVVVVLGAGLNAHTTRNGTLFAPPTVIIQVDTGRPSPLATHHVRLDVSDFLRLLLEAVPNPPRYLPRPPDPRDLAATHVPGGDRMLHPQLLAAEIARQLPVESTIVLDGGNFMAWPLQSWPVRSADAFVPAGLAVQSIGLGLPALIGAGLAKPDRFPVLAVGDGGLLMALADLESAARLLEHGLIVVFNDSAYGAELHQYGPQGLDTGPMRFPTTDFAALATAVGMTSATIRHEDDLVALADWLRNGPEGVMLLDCRIADDVAAPFLAAVTRQRQAAVRPTIEAP